LLTVINQQQPLRLKKSTQYQDKLKPKLNIALEGTCSGDVAGGLLSWTGESLQALLFGRMNFQGISNLPGNELPGLSWEIKSP